MSKLQLVVAIPTLTGSLLSFLATTAAIVAHFVFPPGRHFRHSLILNLLVADGINSLNNSVSGIDRIVNRDKAVPASKGLGCDVNAFIGQLSVQAVDFNILIISLTVLLAVRNKKVVHEPTRLKTACICALPWIPALTTSCVGWGLQAYGPVSGNWCWIRADETELRYALTHGWRIAIFVATLGIYTYIYIHLKRAFDRFTLSTTQGDGTTTTATTTTTTTTDPAGASASRPLAGAEAREHSLDAGDADRLAVRRSLRAESPAPTLPPLVLPSPVRRPPPPSPLSLSAFDHDDEDYRDDDDGDDDYDDDAVPLRDLEAGGGGKRAAVMTTATAVTPTTTMMTMTSTTAAAASAARPAAPPRPLADRVHTRAPRASRANLRRMLLLNGYPALWIALWVPGMATRLLEALAGRAPLWLQVAQASTQYIGLANALTYSWNETTTRRLRALVRWRPHRRRADEKRGRRGTGRRGR